MQGRITIQLKAIFLLLVFSVNTLLGFACSIGVDLGYNKLHHGTTVSAKEEEPAHDCGTTVENETDESSPTSTHDCCNDSVLKFNLADKAVSSVVKLDAPVHAVLHTVALYFLQSWNNQDFTSNNYFVRSHHPPISTDIRISIQSFQI